MPTARKNQISLDAATPYHHCVSRCVRRTFLCGEDNHTGQSYEHRRGWIEDKMLELVEVFALDICAYAIMSNFDSRVQALTNPHEIRNKIDQKQQLNKITINTRIKPRHCEGTQSDCGNLMSHIQAARRQV